MEEMNNQVERLSHSRESGKTAGRTCRTKPFCLFLNFYYQGFMANHYSNNPNLISGPYMEQKETLQRECFGDSDFYSFGLKGWGWNAEEIIVNCQPLQRSWAKENGFSGSDLEIVIEQIRRIQPEVVYLQGIDIGTKDFLSAIRPYVKLIVGQIASPIPGRTDLSGFDILFSSFPHFVERFRQKGLTAYYQPLAFDPRVLERTGVENRIYPTTFVGGVSANHGNGNSFIEKLADLIPMDIWGYGAETLPTNSAIKKCHRGEAWGLEMFSLLHQSIITVNRHIDVSENYANNMRLFEATGCGALLVTDYKDNLNELFKIGEEVVAYRSAEECAALVRYYLEHPEEARKIAHAGQQRTLRDHSYQKRMERTSEILERHLRYTSGRDHLPIPDMSNPDQDHHELTYLFKKTIMKDHPDFDLQAGAEPSTTMSPLTFLNIGCGHRFHPEWTNVDLVSTGPSVKAHNIYMGMPYPDETFDAVYHSHLLEHLPRRFAGEFMKECFRILKPGGTIRVATPDLEQMARAYLDLLERSLEGDREAEKKYEWILIELLDQMVRNQSGGEMYEYWKQNPMPAERYVIDRCGSEVLGALDYIRKNPEKQRPYQDVYLNAIRGNDQKVMMKIAGFRMSGEIHQWMYDRYSLKKLLKDSGFEKIHVCAADESSIPNFNSYLLDIEPNGQVRKPDSFFMEAIKPG